MGIVKGAREGTVFHSAIDHPKQEGSNNVKVCLVKFYPKSFWTACFAAGKRTNSIFDFLQREVRVQFQFCRIRKDWNV